MNPKTALARCRKSLHKAIAQRAKMNRGSYDLQVISTSASMLDGAHRLTFTFTGGRQHPQSSVAWCLAPPSGEPEITLSKELFHSESPNNFEVN
jgi:hypothetical protein